MPTELLMPTLHRRAEFVPSTINVEKRTVEVVWSTGARVRRQSWLGDAWEEELGLLEGEVRLDFLNRGANLLASHDLDQLSSVLGVVERAWVVNAQEARALVRFSDHPSLDRVWHDVRSGILRWISAGYRVYKWRDVTEKGDPVQRMRAIDWEPRELSLVGAPADSGASVRAEGRDDRYRSVVLLRGDEDTEKTMAKPNERAEGGEAATNPGASSTAAGAGEGTRAGGATAVAPASAAPAANEDATRAAVDAERTRGLEIRSIARRSRVPKGEEFAERMIRENRTLDQVRAAAIDALADGEVNPTSNAVSVTRDANDGLGDAIRDALLHRGNPDKYKLVPGSRSLEFRGMSLLELGKECLRARGIQFAGKSKMEIADLALRANATHTTTDFPGLLANVASKTLRDAYVEIPQTFKPFTRRGTLPDFKQTSRLQLGAAPTLTKVNEAGEFKYGTLGEGVEKFQLATYGKILSFTRQLLVNDDLDFISRIPAAMGAAARRMESDVVWGILTANAAMGDGVALFHATHANLGDDALDIAALDELYQLITLQKGLGQEYIGLIPRYVIVPPQLAVAAWQLLVATTQPVLDSTTNPFKGRLEVIVEPRLAGSPTVWYMSADPSQIDTIEYAYLEGEEGPVIETRVGFEVDGIEIKVREDFAAKAIDFRGMAKSTGTA